MRISLNWMKQLADINLPVDELVQKIGAQLGQVEGVENLGAKYEGVLVAKVVACEDHPNADRLHVCKIDDGGVAQNVERDESGYVQVVCGAPNVREGITVAWLPPGSTVPESVSTDPFVLEARELRGVVSNGMLASPKELALSDDHDGILEIDKAVEPGSPFAPVYKLDDYVIDIENKMFTHRPDCFGVLGVTREVKGITHQPFVSPDWYIQDAVMPSKTADLSLSIQNELPELVPRFSAVTVKGVQVKSSPVWLQVALAKLGQKSINNIVDLTNFYMQLTGQPLHAYDYDKVAERSKDGKATIVVRNPHDGEQLALLNGKTIEPRQEAIMIATDQQAIGLAGVMGGAETEVSDTTKNIIIESANFDMYSIRRTSMAHGLFTDAVTRFNKGQSPLQTVTVLAKICQDILSMAGGEVASELIDISEVAGRVSVHPPVPVTVQFINDRLGLELSAADMKQLLENVEMTVVASGDELHVTAPFWRTDIETREDVVEEIGRLYGFDNLPLALPQRSIAPATINSRLALKQYLRFTLAEAGANEVLTYSFVHGNLLEKVGQDSSKAFELSNALSPDLQYYRLSLTPSLLDKVHANSKAGYGEFALFEIGKSHYVGEWDADDDGVPNEDDHLALVFAAGKQRTSGAAYFTARKYLDSLDIDADLVPMSDYNFEADEWGAQLVAPYDPQRSALLVKDKMAWGVVGEFRAAVRRNLKLPGLTAGFEVHLDVVRRRQNVYLPLSKYPSVHQDLTLKVRAEVHFADLEAIVATALEDHAPEQTSVRCEPLGIYQSKDDPDNKNVSFRITVTSLHRTLTDKEVTATVAAVATEAGQRLGAEQV